MTTRLTDRPLLVVAALTLVGTAKHACNMLPLPSNRSFTDNKNAVAPNHATLRSPHHHRFCVSSGNVGRQINYQSADAGLEYP
jgi:hypothetical protein